MMLEVPIVGIAGPAQSGKSTAAKFIKHEANGAIVAMSDAINRMIRAEFGEMPFEYERDEIIPALGVTTRRLQQSLGDWGRDNIGYDVWTQRMWYRALDHYKVRPLIVEGIRTPEEAAFIREKGGVIWHIDNPRAPTVRAHRSEGQQVFLEGDTLVKNHASRGQYARTLRASLQAIGWGR